MSKKSEKKIKKLKKRIKSVESSVKRAEDRNDALTKIVTDMKVSEANSAHREELFLEGVV